MSKMGELALELQQQQMDEAWAEFEAQQEYSDGQDALPPHKRDGYSEKMADYADHLRDLECDKREKT